MNMFVLQECLGIPGSNLLLPISDLASRLSFIKIDLWAFRNIEIVYPLPFGLEVQVFERLSRELKLGFIVSDADFKLFLKKDYQIIDGIVEGYSGSITQGPYISIECFDTSEYDISTPSDDLASELENRGFQRFKPKT